MSPPVGRRLCSPVRRHSHSLAELAAIEAARGSFDAAHDAVTRRCGPVIGKRQLEQAVTAAAVDIPAFYAARIPQPCTSRTLVVLSADSKGIVMRPGALRAATAKAAARLGKMRTRLTAGEKPNRKRMATLVTVYDATRPSKRLANRDRHHRGSMPRAPAAPPRHHARPVRTRRLTGHLTPEELYPMLIEVLEARNASLEGRLINFGASWPDLCARRDDTLFTSDNVTSFGSGFGLAA